jgi:hypothetical protein
MGIGNANCERAVVTYLSENGQCANCGTHSLPKYIVYSFDAVISASHPNV